MMLWWQVRRCTVACVCRFAYWIPRRLTCSTSPPSSRKWRTYMHCTECSSTSTNSRTTSRMIIPTGIVRMVGLHLLQKTEHCKTGRHQPERASCVQACVCC